MKTPQSGLSDQGSAAWDAEGGHSSPCPEPCSQRPDLEDPRIIAVLSDEPLPGCPLPVIGIDDLAAIADFIAAHCGLAPSPANRAAG